MHSKLSNAQCFRNYENISFTAEIEKIIIPDLSVGKDQISWGYSALDPSTTKDQIITSPPPLWPIFRAKRYISKSLLKDMDMMPGFRLKWFYSKDIESEAAFSKDSHQGYTGFKRSKIYCLFSILRYSCHSVSQYPTQIKKSYLHSCI